MAWDEYEGEISMAAARWRLGLLGADEPEIQRLAIRLLEDGYTSPALYGLAGTSAIGLGEEFYWMVERALIDVGYEPPATADAVLYFARLVARDILDGGIGPYEGATHMDALFRHLDGDDYELYFDTFSTFIGAASELDDHPEQ